jgi:eukaryotic-like serine/threonine-protein kinase
MANVNSTSPDRTTDGVDRRAFAVNTEPSSAPETEQTLVALPDPRLLVVTEPTIAALPDPDLLALSEREGAAAATAARPGAALIERDELRTTKGSALREAMPAPRRTAHASTPPSPGKHDAGVEGATEPFAMVTEPTTALPPPRPPRGRATPGGYSIKAKSARRKSTEGGSITLGKYQLVKPLSSGATSHVFLGRLDSADGPRYVAVKSLRRGHVQNSALVTAFHDEGRLLGALHHRGIAECFDVGVSSDGTHYLAMEYLHGETLRAVLHRARTRGYRVPLDFALTAIHDAATALDHIQERHHADARWTKMAYRDVTPASVTATFDGTIKITTFGNAKARAGGGAARRGAFGYAAPETLQGQPPDPRTEVFSLGAVLYELTTQTAPFAAKTPEEWRARTLRGDLTPPSQLVPGYPIDLERVVMTAMAPSPADRFQDCGALAHAISEVCASLGFAMAPAAIRSPLHQLFGARAEPWRETILEGDETHQQPKLTAALAAATAVPIPVPSSSSTHAASSPTRPGLPPLPTRRRSLEAPANSVAPPPIRGTRPVAKGTAAQSTISQARPPVMNPSLALPPPQPTAPRPMPAPTAARVSPAATARVEAAPARAAAANIPRTAEGTPAPDRTEGRTEGRIDGRTEGKIDSPLSAAPPEGAPREAAPAAVGRSRRSAARGDNLRSFELMSSDELHRIVDNAHASAWQAVPPLGASAAQAIATAAPLGSSPMAPHADASRLPHGRRATRLTPAVSPLAATAAALHETPTRPGRSWLGALGALIELVVVLAALAVAALIVAPSNVWEDLGVAQWLPWGTAEAPARSTPASADAARAPAAASAPPAEVSARPASEATLAAPSTTPESAVAATSPVAEVSPADPTSPAASAAAPLAAPTSPATASSKARATIDFEITTEPADATVMLDGEHLGHTPLSLVHPARQGTATLRIRRRGYQTQKIEVNLAQDVVLQVRLRANRRADAPDWTPSQVPLDVIEHPDLAKRPRTSPRPVYEP